MRYAIEVLRAVHAQPAVLARKHVFAFTPGGAARKALALLAQWQTRGATAVRVLNSSGQEIYFRASASDA